MKTYEERYEYVISRIEEEKAKKTTNKTHVIKYVSIAAALVLVVTAAGLAITHVGSVNTPENDGVIVRHLPMDTATATSDEIARAHTWEELIDPARYKEITINGSRYVTKLIAVHAEHEGEFIGTAQITGQDEVTLEMHEQTVSIYSITGMAKEAAVAIRFNDDDEYSYAYVNFEYVPETLGEFIDALNLREELGTSLCYRGHGDDMVYYEDVTTEYIWEALLSDATAVNYPDADPFTNYANKILDICVQVNVLGYHNHAIWLTDNGYLCTNILETGKYFYIGEDKVNAFVDEVINYHQAYKYVYDIPTDDDTILE